MPAGEQLWLALGYLAIQGLPASGTTPPLGEGGQQKVTCGLTFCLTYLQCLRQDRSGDMELAASLEQTG